MHCTWPAQQSTRAGLCPRTHPRTCMRACMPHHCRRTDSTHRARAQCASHPRTHARTRTRCTCTHIPHILRAVRKTVAGTGLLALPPGCPCSPPLTRSTHLPTHRPPAVPAQCTDTPGHHAALHDCPQLLQQHRPHPQPLRLASTSSQQQQQGAGRPDGLILTDLVPDVLALVYDCLPSKEDRRNFHHSCAAPSTRCRSCVPRRVRTKRPVCASLFHTSARLVPHVAFTCFPQHRRLSVCDAGAQDLAALGWKPQGADQFP